MLWELERSKLLHDQYQGGPRILDGGGGGGGGGARSAKSLTDGVQGFWKLWGFRCSLIQDGVKINSIIFSLGGGGASVASPPGSVTEYQTDEKKTGRGINQLWISIVG